MAIVGVLSAIALPQYRIAMEKAKVVAVLPIMSKIREAQQMYFLEYRQPTCDMAELNVKVDFVNEVNEGTGYERKRDNQGNIISPPQADTPTASHACGHSSWDASKPWYGNTWKITLPNQDVLQILANKIIYNNSSNQLWMDYHRLGTQGEEGPWAFSGRGIYNRCEAICYARCRDSIWDKVCKALANGKHARKNGEPLTVSEENCPDGEPAYKYCIEGALR